MAYKNQTATKPQQHRLDKISLSIIRIIVGTLVGMQFILPIIITYNYIKEERISFKETPEDYGLKYENIDIKTEDGLALKGWYFSQPEKSPGVLLVHGIGTNRADLLDIADLLNKNGYAVLTFDLRAHGLSDGDKRTFGINEYYDIESALRTLATKNEVDENRLGIYAVSYGGAMTIQSMYKSDFVKENLKALFVDSPYADLEWMIEEKFPFRRGFITPIAGYISKLTAKFLLADDPFKDQPIEIISSLEQPIFFVHGAEDQTINKRHSIALHQLKKFGYKYIWLAPLSDHLMSHYDYPEEYESKLVDFFDKYLGK